MAGPPFNPNTTSPASSDLISAHPASERASRADLVEWLTFLSEPTTGIIKTAALPSAATDIPTGTKMLFVQTAAPTGWTKDVTHNNKALRIVNGTAGTGGTATFTDVFTSKAVTGTTDGTTASGTVGSTTLTIDQIPSHDHTAGTLSGTSSTGGAHDHSLLYGIVGAGGTVGDGIVASAGSPSYTSVSGTHNHSVTINTGATAVRGGGLGHTHTFAGASHTHTFTGTAIDLAVAYVDVIIATRN